LSFFSELKRRKVLKVGGAYLVIAWGLIQVATTLAPVLNLPDWAPRLITLLVLLGFPVAVLLSWMLDVTPEGIRVDAATPGNKRIYAFVVVLAAVAVGWYWKGRAALSGDLAEARSIAVLPFVNMSGDPKNDYFSDGISEEILNVLARTPDLQVAARTSSFAFKGQAKEVPEIARDLHVRMVLEGSVRQQGDRVRITAQLIDASTGFHLWSQTYDRELKDVFAIQDDIAKAIGEELQVQVGGARPAGTESQDTVSPEAHDLYLRGLALWQARTEQSLWDARDVFERATAADPGFARAFAGLALAYSVLPDYTARISYEDAFARGREAAERALALDPLLPEAYAALGDIEMGDNRMVTAVALLRRAIEMSPSFASAHQWLGSALAGTGNVAEGITSLRRAAQLDPRSAIVANNYATVLIMAGRNADAIAESERCLGFEPDSRLCLETDAFALLLQDGPEAARAALLRWAAATGPGRDPQVEQVLAALEGKGDRRATARLLASFSQLEINDPTLPVLFSNLETPTLLVLLGEPELAIDYIVRGAEDKFGSPTWGMALPAVDPIRCDPRFREAARKLGFDDPRVAQVCG
jgi:adenylate cyclase